jgi:hypothetical protein
MKKVLMSVLLLLTACLWLTAIAQASLYSGFDSSTEGWTTEGATAPVFNATGGNPGGFISAYDNAGTWWKFVSPNSWDGDWTSYADGVMQFDLKPLRNNANQYEHYVEIWSGANYMWWSPNIYPLKGAWTHFQVDFIDANFTEVGATFSQILRNVTALKILGDLVGGTGTSDTTGLDNVRVDPIPLPGAVWFLGSGLLGLAGLRRRFTR